MATLADVRRIALSLPGAQELNDHGVTYLVDTVSMKP